MAVRQASFDDLLEVIYLVRRCIIDMNERGYKQWNSSNPSTNQLKEDIHDGTLYIYKEHEIVRGMLNLTNEPLDEYKEINWKSNANKVLYISRFAVDPIWQTSDISAKLMDFTEEFAKKNGYSSIRLDILGSYPVDEKFYDSRKYLFAGTFHSSFQKIPYACYEKNI